MLTKNMFLYLIFVLEILLILQSQTHRTRPGSEDPRDVSPLPSHTYNSRQKYYYK